VSKYPLLHIFKLPH